MIWRRRTPRFFDLVDRLEAAERLWATELSTSEKVLQHLTKTGLDKRRPDVEETEWLRVQDRDAVSDRRLAAAAAPSDESNVTKAIPERVEIVAENGRRSERPRRRIVDGAPSSLDLYGSTWRRPRRVRPQAVDLNSPWPLDGLLRGLTVADVPAFADPIRAQR